MVSELEFVRQLVKNARPNWPEPVKRIGQGANGIVYETNDGRVLKLTSGKHTREFKTLERLQGTYVVPRFRKGNFHFLNLGNKASSVRSNLNMMTNNNPYFTMFLMGRVGNASNSMTLLRYLRKYPQANRENIDRRIQYILSELHSRGVSHGNFHHGNIIVRVGPSGRITGMWVVDFTRSTQIERGKTEPGTKRTMGVSNYETVKLPTNWENRMIKRRKEGSLARRLV